MANESDIGAGFNQMAKEFENAIIKAFESATQSQKFLNLFKVAQIGAGEAPGTQQIVQLLKIAGQESRKRDKMEVDANRSRLVMLNIMKRAELRDKAGGGMPNIASLLAGKGGGSVTGHLGRFQKMGEKPFADVFNYQKKMEEFMSKPKSERDPKEKAVLDAEKAKLPNALLGKKMGGMIGKVGKFMESGAGQGMMGAGMMGASILTMVIKKAIQASPMMQAMLKIMNTAIMLYLRPIGDFIGGMLRPIALFFMREIAIPALRAGKGMMNMGQELGKAMLGFALKPIESIQKAITKSLSRFPFFKEVMGGEKEMEKWERYDPVKDWMLDRKLETISKILEKETGEVMTQQELVQAMKNPNLISAAGIYGTTAANTTSQAVVNRFQEAVRKFELMPEVMAKYGYEVGEMQEQYDMVEEAKLSNIYGLLDTKMETLNTTSKEGSENIVTSVDNSATLVAGAVSTAITTAAAQATETAMGVPKTTIPRDFVGPLAPGDSYAPPNISLAPGFAYGSPEDLAAKAAVAAPEAAKALTDFVFKSLYSDYVYDENIIDPETGLPKTGIPDHTGGMIGKQDRIHMAQTKQDAAELEKQRAAYNEAYRIERLNTFNPQNVKDFHAGILPSGEKLTPAELLAWSPNLIGEGYDNPDKYKEGSAAQAAAMQIDPKSGLRYNTTTQKVVGEPGNWRLESSNLANTRMQIYNELTNKGQNPVFSAIEKSINDAKAKEAISQQDLANTQEAVTKMVLAGQDWSSNFAGIFGPTLTQAQKDAGPLAIIGEVLGTSSSLTDLFGTSGAQDTASKGGIKSWSGYADAVSILNSGNTSNWAGGYSSRSNQAAASAMAAAQGNNRRTSGVASFARTAGSFPGGAKGGRFSSMAGGGWITEPIFGWGASGTAYNLGEAGPELVTPADQVGGIIANISINIDKIAQDIDLEQIKPIVERALLEVHARRGII